MSPTLFPLLPNSQGLSNQKFRLPSLDPNQWKGVPQLLDEQAEKNPSHPVFIYDTPNGNVYIRFSEYILMVHSTAARIARELSALPTLPSKVVAVLAVVDSISFVTMMMAIMRAGLIPFSVSPQNSPQGLAYLLDESNAAVIYATTDRTTRALTTDALEILRTTVDRAYLPLVLSMPTFEEISDIETPTQLDPILSPELDSVALMLHSSGSTSAVSKITKISHRMYLQYGMMPYYGNLDICGESIAAQAIPIQHTMCATLATWPASTGITIAFLRPLTPPLVPTFNIVLDSVLATNSTMLVTVPSFLELWSKTQGGLNMLKSLKTVVYAGAPLQTHVGNYLSSQGVNLQNAYGSMETGSISRTFIQTNGGDWVYFELSPQANIVLTPHSATEDDGHDLDLFVPTIADSPSLSVSISNTTTLDGTRAFQLDDLLQRHATNPVLYKVYGRLDDQIVLSSGFKINAGPIESFMRKHHKIAYAIVFGHGKERPGLLLEFCPEFAFEPKHANAETEEQFREEVWSTVVDAIQGAQSQSRIARKMIIFASPTKPFTLTAKRNPRRSLILQAYREEIASLYT